MKSSLPLHSLVFSGSFLFISVAVPITSVAISFNSVAFRSWTTSIFSSINNIENLLSTVFPVICDGTTNIKNQIVNLFGGSSNWDLYSGMNVMSEEFQSWFKWAKGILSSDIKDSQAFSFSSVWEFTKVFWNWLFSESETNFNFNTILQIIKNDQFFNLLSALRTIFTHHPGAFSRMQVTHIDQLLKYFSEVATPDKKDQLTKRIKNIFENSKKIQNKNFGQDFGKLLKALVMEEPQSITFLKSLIDSVIDSTSNLLFSSDENSKTTMNNIKKHITDIIDAVVLNLADKTV